MRTASTGTYERLLADEQFRFALLHPIQIIGEAARMLSSEAKLGFPDIPWSAIIALRNVIVHDYTGIDYEAIWDVVTINVPGLISRLRGTPPSEEA